MPFHIALSFVAESSQVFDSALELGESQLAIVKVYSERPSILI